MLTFFTVFSRSNADDGDVTLPADAAAAVGASPPLSRDVERKTLLLLLCDDSDELNGGRLTPPPPAPTLLLVVASNLPADLAVIEPPLLFSPVGCARLNDFVFVVIRGDAPTAPGETGLIESARALCSAR